jgi:flagellar motility protein MotE (MotC chaperone)
MTRDIAELTDEALDDTLFPKAATPEELEDLALGDDYALNPEYVEMVVDAADSGDTKRLRELVGALEPADVADLMGFLSADYREEVIPLLDPEALGEIISEMDENLREEILEATPSVTLARALEELDTDDAADVIDDLDDTKRFQVLAAMGETRPRRHRDDPVLRGRDRRPPDAARIPGRAGILDRRPDHRSRPRLRRLAARAVLRRLCGRPDLQAGRRHPDQPPAAQPPRDAAAPS